MKIGGMGYAILRVTAEQLRELHTLPYDLVFERTVGGTRPNWTDINPDWTHDEHPFYFRIRHRYLPRVGDRGPIVCFTFGELKKQFAVMIEKEHENRDATLTELLRENGWVDD